MAQVGHGLGDGGAERRDRLGLLLGLVRVLHTAMVVIRMAGTEWGGWGRSVSEMRVVGGKLA
ncbi:MAG: hypothetical protein BGO49_17665 [Planctomycetales bacterium 71-10]|nr:MAG: hypothetical protein BGO49_17665 [Planctomycetales bacterium 71-10]